MKRAMLIKMSNTKSSDIYRDIFFFLPVNEWEEIIERD